jgi:hypothetical protein
MQTNLVNLKNFTQIKVRCFQHFVIFPSLYVAKVERRVVSQIVYHLSLTRMEAPHALAINLYRMETE